MRNSFYQIQLGLSMVNGIRGSVNSVVEFPGAGLGRLITINSELNGAI